jgi:hypothetical protein
MKFIKMAVLTFGCATMFAACSSSATNEPATSTPGTSNNTAPADAPPKLEPKASEPRLLEVPAGTVLQISLSDSLNSGKNNSGDRFEGTLAAPVIVKEETVLRKGTKVHGRVVDAKESGRVKGLASLRLTLTDFVHEGKAVPISTKDWFTEAENTKKRDAGIIGGGAGIGAAIGAIAGGKKGAAEGAAIGGGAGTGTVLVTKGKEVELAPEAKLKFTLEKGVEITAPVQTATKD